jgi:hypothetical protein
VHPFQSTPNTHHSRLGRQCIAHHPLTPRPTPSPLSGQYGPSLSAYSAPWPPTPPLTATTICLGRWGCTRQSSCRGGPKPTAGGRGRRAGRGQTRRQQERAAEGLGQEWEQEQEREREQEQEQEQEREREREREREPGLVMVMVMVVVVYKHM